VKVTLSPTIKFHEVEASAGSAEFGFEYTELQPVVSGSGAGEAEPSWDYEALPGLRLHGSKWMHLLVSAPKAMRTASATLTLSADLAYRGLRLPSFLKPSPTEPAKSLSAHLWG
jgi:hypothetical protein